MIPFTDLAKALRSPESAPFSPTIDEKRQDSASRADHDAPAALLRSPCGLAPQHGGTPTLHTNHTHQLSQQVDR